MNTPAARRPTLPFPGIRAAITSLFIVCALLVSAQYTEPLMSHYYELGSFYNPGAAGRTDLVNIRAGGRLQWVGIDNAPVSFVGVADMPFKIGRKRLATGLALQHESYGLYRNLTLGAMIAYKLRLFGGTLTPGVRIGLINQSFRGSEVFIPDDNEYHSPTDDAIPTTDVGGNALDLGVGISFDIRSFSAGLSVLHANSPTVRFSSDSSMSGSRDGEDSSTSDPGVKNYEFPVSSTLYFTAAGNIPIKNTLFEVIPSILIVSDFNDATGIVTARLRYSKRFSFGAGYRYRDGVSINLGLELKNFYIGYTYEYPLSSLNRASSGSHELLAGYSLKLDFNEKNKHKHKSIRIL
ncbi:MAG: PorP/SprF family type IX secretion system membrane protein [Bacteroides sp.]|nr:PorP/SprF family type IX secretion system membrane protein [Bacteroides sp.]